MANKQQDLDKALEDFIRNNWRFVLFVLGILLLFFSKEQIFKRLNISNDGDLEKVVLGFISSIVPIVLFLIGLVILRSIVLFYFHRKRFMYVRILPHEDDWYKKEDVFRLMQRFHGTKRKWISRLILGREWYSYVIYRDKAAEYRFYLGADKKILPALEAALKTIYPRVEFYNAEGLVIPGKEAGRSLVGGRMKIKSNSVKKALPLARFQKDDLPAIMLQMPPSSWFQVNFSANDGKEIRKSILSLEKEIKKDKGFSERSTFDKEELQGLHKRYQRNEIAFDCTVSMATTANDGVRHLKSISNIINSNLHDVNELTYRRYRYSISFYPKHYVYRMLWTGGELANLIHLPFFDDRESIKSLQEFLPTNRKGAELLPQNVFANPEGIELGQLTHPIVQDRKVYVLKKMLSDHFLVTGKTGSGKSSLLNSILNGFLEDFVEKDLTEGFTFIDPGRDTAIILLNRLLKAEGEGKRVNWNKVHWISFANAEYPVAMNLLYKREGEHQGLIADSITELIESNFPDKAAVAERLLRFSIRTLLADDKPHTILEVKKLIDDFDFRRKLLDKLSKDPSNYEIIDYWETDGPTNMKTSAMAVKNRIDMFSSSPVLKRVFGQFEMNLDIRKFMEEGHIVFFDVSSLNALEMSVISGYISYMYYRIAETRSTYPLLHLLVFDEAARVGYVSKLEKIIAESRKFGLTLGVSTQRLGQLSEGLRDALVNVQDNFFILQQGAEDAPLALKFINQGDQVYKQEFLTGLTPRYAFIRAKDTVNGVTEKHSCMIEVAPLDKYKPDLTIAKHGTNETELADAWTLEKARQLTMKSGRTIKNVDYEIMKYMNPRFDFETYEREQQKNIAEKIEKEPVKSLMQTVPEIPEYQLEEKTQDYKKNSESEKVEDASLPPLYDIELFKEKQEVKNEESKTPVFEPLDPLYLDDEKEEKETKIPEKVPSLVREETKTPEKVQVHTKNDELSLKENNLESEKMKKEKKEKEEGGQRVSLMDLAKQKAGDE